MGNINNNPPPAHINTHLYTSAMRYVKKEPTQLSPVKKRIKENKDHYVFADSNYSSASHSPLEHHSQHYANNVARDSLNNAIIINDDTPPLQHSRNAAHHVVPEVITIFDSDDDTPPAEDHVKSENPASNASSAASANVKQDATTPVSSASTIAVATATASLNTSGCPSVMPITPVMMLRQEGYSAQSTPSRSHAASCVTVNGDSDEDYQRTPIKQQRTPVTCTTTKQSDQGSTLSRKNRLLAKAQSEWMLSTLKEENPPMNTPITYGYTPTYSRSSMIDDKDLIFNGYPSSSTLRQMNASRDYLEQQHQLLRERERDMEAHAAVAAREMQEREREYADVAAAAALEAAVVDSGVSRLLSVAGSKREKRILKAKQQLC